MSAWKDGTKKQYQTYIRKWIVYADSKNVNPQKPAVNDIVEFLTHLFDSGLGYSALNTARSSMSSLFKFDSKPVGEHPYVKKLLKGMFNLKPALPKNNITWDPQLLLNYLGLMSNINITFKNLSLKCVTLLWLLSAQRGQTIQMIDVRNVHVGKDSVKIRFGDLLKTSRPGFQQREISLKAYEQNSNICIVEMLSLYIQTRARMVKDCHTQLFVSYQKPYAPITKDTLARWVKSVMSSAGIDTSIFTPHSLRAASTSAAARNKVPLDTILATAGWSKESTFRKFYNKPINQTYSII